MKGLLRIINAISLLIFTGSVAQSQSNADSLRIVTEALQMIAFPEPVFSGPFVYTPSAKDIADMGFEQLYESEQVKYKMRDGVQINTQKYSYSANRTVVLVHGALGSSYTNNKLSGLLRESLQAEVFAIDLRGHGQSGGVPGDVSYSNQYIEDVEDIINSIKEERPEQEIILAGHSMGGGIILRHAETFGTAKVDAYLLFAPNLGTNAPTSSQDLDIQNNFIKVHLSRGLGLYMLNQLGLHKYDSMKVVFYNLPEQMPVRSYSYRSMIGGYPADYRAALRRIDKPMLVLIGSEDEAFLAEEFEPVIKGYSNGDIYLVEGESHNGIRHSAVAMERIKEWAFANRLRE